MAELSRCVARWLIEYGQNPNQPDQYSGSVVEKHQTMAVPITGLHENGHQSEMNGDAPLSFFADSFMEKITGGNTSGADGYAVNTMMKNPQIEGEFLQKVGQCKVMHPGQ